MPAGIDDAVDVAVLVVADEKLTVSADGYTGGSSESIIGDYLAETRRRDQVVLATKFTFNGRPGDPNAGGNGRKNIHRALEGSLRRSPSAP